MRKRKVVRPKQVEEEIVKIADYIAKDNLDAAIRFYEAVEEACQKISEMPELGSLIEISHPKVAKVRVWQIRGFEKFLILYKPIRDEIIVLHVVHGARDLFEFLGLKS